MNLSAKTAMCIAAMGILLTSGVQSDDEPVIKKCEDGTIVVNTTSIAQDVEGYMGPTPVLISIQKGKVTKVTPLANKETPSYMRFVEDEGLFNRWDGMDVKKVEEAEVDAVTGATFTSNAVIENVRRGVQLYQKEHKKRK